MTDLSLHDVLFLAAAIHAVGGLDALAELPAGLDARLGDDGLWLWSRGRPVGFVHGDTFRPLDPARLSAVLETAIADPPDDLVGRAIAAEIAAGRFQVADHPVEAVVEVTVDTAAYGVHKLVVDRHGVVVRDG